LNCHVEINSFTGNDNEQVVYYLNVYYAPCPDEKVQTHNNKL